MVSIFPHTGHIATLEPKFHRFANIYFIKNYSRAIKEQSENWGLCSETSSLASLYSGVEVQKLRPENRPKFWFDKFFFEWNNKSHIQTIAVKYTKKILLNEISTITWMANLLRQFRREIIVTHQNNFYLSKARFFVILKKLKKNSNKLNWYLEFFLEKSYPYNFHEWEKIYHRNLT